MKHLNRIFFLLLVGTLLQLSCSKENNFTEYGKDELVNLQGFKPNSQSTSETPNSCYNTYITDTYGSLKLAGTIPFANLVGNALANAIYKLQF